MTHSRSQSRQSTGFFVAIFTAIITALFLSILGYNSWLTQRSLSTNVSQPIERLIVAVQSLNDKLTGLELRTATRLVSVESDVEDISEDVAELKGRVARLEDRT